MSPRPVNDTTANAAVSAPPSATSSAVSNVVRENVGRLAFAGTFLFSALWGIRSFGIQDNNEGIYAEIAREMNVRGDWVIPHLNGAPYLEKPPLLYWLIATLLRVFGEHEWVVRLGPVLCFAGTLGAVVWIGRQINGRALGRNAALLLCSAAGVVGMSRSLLFDVPLTCALMWALGFFLQWRLGGSRWNLRACYALLAVGVMTKGLIAVVLGGGTMLVATLWARRSWRDLWALLDPIGALLFAGIVVPWHVLACLREPGFADFYFINEHVRRFLGSREPHDFYTGPVYYYLVRLPLYLGVWVFALPLLARNNHVERGSRQQVAIGEGRRVLLSAAAVALAFFSFSEGKANYYLLCIMPALALLIALAWPRDGRRAKRLLFCAAGIALIATLLAAAPWLFRQKPDVVTLLQEQRTLVGSIALALATLAIAVAAFVLRAQNRAAFACIATAGLVLLLPLPTLLHAADARISERELAQYLAGHDEDPVVLYREYEPLSSMVFYLRRTVPVIDSQSNELYYAHQRYAAGPSFMDLTRFRVLSREHRVWIVTTPDHVADALTRLEGSMPRVVRRFPRAVVLEAGPSWVTTAASHTNSPTIASTHSARVTAGLPSAGALR